MELVLTRRTFTPKSTISDLTRDGVKICVVLEDCDRGLDSKMPHDEIERRKIFGVTAIPTGNYPVIVTYSPRFKRAMPLVGDVPGYLGIRIHRGAIAEHTEGCLLPGEHEGVDVVYESAEGVARVEALLAEAKKRGENVRLRITRDAAAWAAFQAKHPEIVKVAA